MLFDGPITRWIGDAIAGWWTREPRPQTERPRTTRAGPLAFDTPANWQVDAEPGESGEGVARTVHVESRGTAQVVVDAFSECEPRPFDAWLATFMTRFVEEVDRSWVAGMADGDLPDGLSHAAVEVMASWLESMALMTLSWSSSSLRLRPSG